jgi:hypothetical protein
MARSFNGTNQALSSASVLSLGSATALTIAFWLWIDAWGGTDMVIVELGNGAGTDGCLIYSGAPGGSAVLVVNLDGNVGGNNADYTQPGTGAWHHYVATFDKGLASNEVNLYLDGSLQTPTTRRDNNNNTNAFGDNTLYFMARTASTLWRSGRLADMAVWTSVLSGGNITSLNAGTLPDAISPTPAYYWKLCADPVKPGMKSMLPEPASIGGIDLNRTGDPLAIAHPNTVSLSCPGLAHMSYNQFPKFILRQPLAGGRTR